MTGHLRKEEEEALWPMVINRRRQLTNQCSRVSKKYIVLRVKSADLPKLNTMNSPDIISPHQLSRCWCSAVPERASADLVTFKASFRA